MKAFFFLIALALVGCATELVLVPPPGSGGVAAAEGANVRLEIDAVPWSGEPRDLASRMTPVHVVIANHSAHRVRLAFGDFAIIGSRGVRYAPVDLVPGEPAQRSEVPARWGEVVLVDSHGARPVAPPRPPLAPRFHSRGFYLAPHYRPWYPHFFLWPHMFFYAPLTVAPWPTPLPTEDMLSEGLPEGVLEQHGSVDGFLFFHRLPASERAVRFELTLVDADTQTTFGTLSVPLMFRP